MPESKHVSKLMSHCVDPVLVRVTLLVVDVQEQLVAAGTIVEVLGNVIHNCRSLQIVLHIIANCQSIFYNERIPSMRVLEVAVRILGIREVVLAELEGVSVSGSCRAYLVALQGPGTLDVLLTVITGELVVETIPNETIRPGHASWVGLCMLARIMIAIVYHVLPTWDTTSVQPSVSGCSARSISAVLCVSSERYLKLLRGGGLAVTRL